MAQELVSNPHHEAIDSFMELYNPLAVSQHLRVVFLTALRKERFVEAGDLDEIMDNISGLFDLLDDLVDKSVYRKE